MSEVVPEKGDKRKPIEVLHEVREIRVNIHKYTVKKGGSYRKGG